jgi:hypothetical protein
MNGGLFDVAKLTRMIGDVPELANDAESREQIADRFARQYLAAWTRATNDEMRERVWLAFWSYLTSVPTPRKPFELSEESADVLIRRMREEVEGQR